MKVKVLQHLGKLWKDNKTQLRKEGMDANNGQEDDNVSPECAGK